MAFTDRFQHTQSRFIFYFLVAALLPLMLFCSASAFYWSHTIVALESAKLESIRDLKVREINSWLDEQMASMRLIAEDEEIRNLEGPFSHTNQSLEDLQLAGRALALLSRNLQYSPSYSKYFIVNAQTGKIELSTEKSEDGTSYATQSDYLEVVKNHTLVILDAHISRQNSQPALGFALPIFANSDAHRLIGVLITELNLSTSLYPLLADRTGLGQTGETLVVNKNVFFINPLRSAPDAPLRLSTQALPSVLAAKGNTGVVRSRDYRGIEVLAAHTHIPRLHWGFVAKQDITEILAPIDQLLKYSALVLAVLIVGILVLVRWLAGTVAGPVLELAEVSRRLRGGDFTARNSIHRIDELGMLATSFNEMADFMAHRLEVEHAVSELNDTMVQTKRIETFFSDLLRKMIELTGASLGAAYNRSVDGLRFELAASIGAGAPVQRAFDPATMEGELGILLASPRIQWLSGIPEDTRFVFNAVAGQAIPRDIVTVPLLAGGQVSALISLASLKPIASETLDTLHRSWPTMNAALANLLAQEHTRQLARELTIKNEELLAQSSELQAQTDELRVQTEELREQASEMDAQRAMILEADRLKSEFLSNMSHELRTPLNSVLALSQLMLNRGTGRNPEREAEYLRVIERNGRHLLSLINDILDLSKIESGRMDLTYGEADMRELIIRSIDTVRPLAEAKGLTIETEFDDHLRLSTDEGKVVQILVNMISNAIKFSDHGTIGVSAHLAGNSMRIAVSDEGIGIDSNDIPYIFDEFRQVDGSTTRRHEGTGLGLSICQKLSNLLGGEITVKSKPGEGSRFTLHLPLCQPQRSRQDSRVHGSNGGAKRPGAEHAGATRPWPQPPVVLIAEDNEVARLQIGSVISDIGGRALEAAGGAEALEIMSQSAPDLLILDLMMPGVDGFQVLERMRAIPALADMPVLVLTAKELSWNERARLATSNVQELVQKGSIDRDQLSSCIRNLLGNWVVKASADGCAPEVAQPDLTPAASAPSAPQAELRRLVLVVEDNPDNRFTISEVLDGMSMEYVMAEDGRRGVELAQQLRPGLVLMDIQLPVLSGLDATRLIKADPALSIIPVIALTAKAMAGDSVTIMAAGCDGYLSKPFSPQDLEGVVRQWLS